ncbi:putative catalase [Diaporthe ampelina]|uniref:Putative catalase n=1 Tax=Diaporthe ampelina TaxID=1214573 RepID=A0A0G2FXY3_9PEZI|nr:putative catalase [Diaporthe ampelina]
MENDNDWQDAAFNTRHLHNRNDRGGRGQKRHEFQVSSMFGTHLIKCPAIDRLQADSAHAAASAGSSNKDKRRRSSASGEVVLEIYRLTDDEDGLLGSLKSAGVIDATVVFAGSRKLLWRIWSQLGGTGTTDSVEAESKGQKTAERMARLPNGKEPSGGRGASWVDVEDEEDGEGDDDDDDDDDLQSISSSLDSEERQRRRTSTFEKNSFRHPKFWFRWQGEISNEASSAAGKGDHSRSVHGSGYIVFSGNDCKRFQGTMTSEQLAWNNAKMSGWKAKPQPERDFEVGW